MAERRKIPAEAALITPVGEFAEMVKNPEFRALQPGEQVQVFERLMPEIKDTMTLRERYRTVGALVQGDIRAYDIEAPLERNMLIKNILSVFEYVLGGPRSAVGTFRRGMERTAEETSQLQSVMLSPEKRKELQQQKLAGIGEAKSDALRALGRHYTKFEMVPIAREETGFVKGLAEEVFYDPMTYALIAPGFIRWANKAVKARTMSAKAPYIERMVRALSEKNPEMAKLMRKTSRMEQTKAGLIGIEADAAATVDKLAKGNMTALREIKPLIQKHGYEVVEDFVQNRVLSEARKYGTLPQVSKNIQQPLNRLFASRITDSQKLAAKVAGLHNKSGGASVTMKGADLYGKPGFAVSLFPEREAFLASRNPAIKDIHKYILKNGDALNGRNFIGTWWDDAAKRTELNVSGRFTNKAEAFKAAQAKGQRFIFDLGAGEEIAVPAAAQAAAVGGGLRFGEKLPSKLRNVNLDLIYEPYGTRHMVTQVIENNPSMFRPRSRTFKQVSATANRLGVEQGDLIKAMKRGFLPDDAHMKAYADLVGQTIREAREMADFAVHNPTDEAMLLADHAMQKSAAVMSELHEAKSRIGAALNSAKLGIRHAQDLKDPVVRVRAFERLLGRRGKEMTAEMIQKFLSLDPTDEAGMARFVRSAVKATTRDQLYEIWISSLLSMPPTQVVNVLGNVQAVALSPVERVVGAGIEQVKALAGREKQIFFREIPSEMYGMYQGFKLGVPKALRAWQTEIVEGGITKLDYIQRTMAVPGQTGRAIRIPLRFLTAFDEFFKSVNYQGEIHAMAKRTAIKEGAKGLKLRERVASLALNPTDEMVDHAAGEALYRVFQKELGQVGRGYYKWRDVTPGLEYITPFIRTPVNLAKFGLERTPLAFPVIGARAAMGTLKGADLSMALSKATIGSAIGATTAIAALEGKITGGGPRNPAAYKAWADTHQPYSVEVGGKWYSYDRFDPLGIPVGMVANFIEAMPYISEGEAEDFAWKTADAFTETIINKTYMRNLSNLFSAFVDPERYGERFYESYARTVVPRFVAGAKRVTDPEIKDPENLLEVIMAELPFASQEVSPRYNLWGEPIMYGEGAIARGLIPSRIKTVVKDKVKDETLRLGKEYGYFSYPSKSVRRVELTSKEHEWLVVSAGQRAKGKLDKIINKPSWDRKRDRAKFEIMRGVIMAERDRARAMLFKRIMADPERKKKYLTKFK